ncbi:hypothetical protein G6F57_022499 [Rhizopus arrhizus]|nr:hypothetical protein G6F57_022499 [Rhizopus arrhizus]
MVHEPVRAEQHERRQQQHADFSPRAARAEPTHGGRGKRQRRQGGAGHDQRQLPSGTPWMPVLIGSSPDIAAAANVANPTGGVMSAMMP